MLKAMADMNAPRVTRVPYNGFSPPENAVNLMFMLIRDLPGVVEAIYLFDEFRVSYLD